MTLKNFFKRRLIRLHPMIVLGVVLGVITFIIQGSVKWDGSHTPFSMVALAALMSFFLLPATPGSGVEVRGNGEMFPLNGPIWSLFFEYIANILYALSLRRMSNKMLVAFVAIMAAGLATFSIGNLSGYGNLGVGWSLADYNLPGGLLRVLFSFSAGMLISRVFTPVNIKGAFWICSLLIVVLLSMPYVGGKNSMWMNGIYDALCVIVVFPILVYLGASGKTSSKTSSKISKFLGDISYPLYIVHYPFMYLFYAWLWKNNLTFSQTWPVALVLLIGNILLAYLCLRLYDIPVRKYLTKRFLLK